MTTTPRRALAAVVATLALTAPVAMSTSATATPDDKHGSSKAPKTKQLLKTIDVKDAQLERLTTAERTTELADDVETTFVANIDTDRTALATLRADAEAVGSTLDAAAVRKDLHDFRVGNYVRAGNILRKAEKLEAELATDPAAAAHLADAVDAALEITAESTKAEVRAARDLLKLAKHGADEDEAPAPAL